ncbi:MAG: M20/M25/M40 family metallo-hydrolase [Vicinamibacterales bacterium]
MTDRSSAVELLRGLVAIPSLSHDESAATEWLVAEMRRAGYERAFVDEAGNAVGEIGSGDAARTIVLLGHIDTVPGAIPVRIEASPNGERLFGRGSVDAKGPLATFVAAVARLDPEWTRDAGLRVVVVGAVEEEAATSKGARFIAARFDGRNEPIPDACVIGEPSQWHRITLGYKGRLLLDLIADQPMAHTAGPDASLASVVVDLWNWVAAQSSVFNHTRQKPFDQLTPSLRRFITSTNAEMHDRVDAQIAWRLPLGFDIDAFVAKLTAWTHHHLECGGKPMELGVPGLSRRGGNALGLPEPDVIRFDGRRTSVELRFRGWEQPWRADRNNALVRSFLAAIRGADASVQPGFVLKTGTSDMNVVGPAWRCPIVAYGPGDSALDHTPHEHLSLDEYWRAIGVVEAALRAFAQ